MHLYARHNVNPTYIDSRHLLHPLNAQSQVKALVGLDATRLEKVHPAALLLRLDLNGLEDLLPFLSNIGIIHWLVSKLAQDQHAIVGRALVSHQPAWRVRQEWCNEDNVDREDELEEQREAPLDTGVVEVEAVVDLLKQAISRFVGVAARHCSLTQYEIIMPKSIVVV